MKYRILFALAALACTARATIIKITITGTVSFGSDLSGVFLGSGCTQNTPCNLAGKSFTLVFTFDDTLGQQYFGSNISYIQQTPSSNPGTALLTINNNSFEFAAPAGRRLLTSTAQSDIPPGRYDEYSVGTSDLGAAVGGHLYPATGRSFGNGVDWRTSFTYLGSFAPGGLVANINEASERARPVNIDLVPNGLQVNGVPASTCAPLSAVIQVTSPDGTKYTPTTWVKNPDQAMAWTQVTGTAVTVGQTVPIPVPPGEDSQALVNQWRSGSIFNGDAEFAWFWREGGPHDYKNLESLGSCRAMFDAYGNFLYGATGNAAGYLLDTLLIWGNLLHGGLNYAINSFDISSGFNAIAQGGTLGTTDWNSLTPTP